MAHRAGFTKCVRHRSGADAAKTRPGRSQGFHAHIFTCAGLIALYLPLFAVTRMLSEPARCHRAHA